MVSWDILGNDMGLFNSQYVPTGLDARYGNAEAGLTPYDYDYAKAFNIPGLTAARMQSDGTYELAKAGDDPKNAYRDYRATAKVGPNGEVTLGDWKANEVGNFADGVKGLAGVAGLGLGGLALAGAGPLAGLFGGGASAAAADPIGAYLTSGGVEGSLGGASALGGAAVAPNLAATNPALIESAVGTPGYGASSAGAGGAASSGLLGGLGDALKKIGIPNMNVGDLLKVGGLLGAVGAGGSQPSYNGPMPTIQRSGWQASVTPQYRQMNSPGLLPLQQGNKTSGLWRYLGGAK